MLNVWNVCVLVWIIFHGPQLLQLPGTRSRKTSQRGQRTRRSVRPARNFWLQFYTKIWFVWNHKHIMMLVSTQKPSLCTCSEYIERVSLMSACSSLTPRYHVITLLSNFQLSMGIAMLMGLMQNLYYKCILIIF